MQSLLETSEKEKVGIMEQWTDVEQQKQKADKHVLKLQVLLFVLCICVALSLIPRPFDTNCVGGEKGPGTHCTMPSVSCMSIQETDGI